MESAFGRGIIGHETILRLMSSWVSSPANGYVFYGPAHLGKTSVAEQFISALLAADGERVGNIRIHPDCTVLEPPEGKSIIPSKDVREARALLSTRPFISARRILYVPSADRLNEEGMNALLKILEEPPADAMFVFVTERYSQLPATVRSRLVGVPFQPVSTSTITQALIERGIPSAEAEKRAVASRGRPGLAIEPADRHPLGERLFSASSLGERLEVIEFASKDCESSEMADSAWRTILDDAAQTVSDRLADDPERSLVIGEGIIAARRMAGSSVSPRLALDAASIRLSSSAPIRGLFPSHLPSPYPRILNAIL